MSIQLIGEILTTFNKKGVAASTYWLASRYATVDCSIPSDVWYIGFGIMRCSVGELITSGGILATNGSAGTNSHISRLRFCAEITLSNTILGKVGRGSSLDPYLLEEE